MTLHNNRRQYLFLSLIILLLASNYVIYHVSLPFDLQSGDMTWVAVGSLVDLIVLVPILLLTMIKGKKFSWTRLIASIAFGAAAARLIIPMTYFGPFRYIPYAALTVEVGIILVEMGLILLLFWRLPKVISAMRQSNVSPLFSFQPIISEKVSQHMLVRIFAADLLIFYYAFASWRKNPPKGDHVLTLHKNTSVTAFTVVIIHAMLIETIGIHWWLHNKSLILSLILLFLNIYSVIFFIGDLHALRLNPLIIKDKKVYLSLGLMKRMLIPFEKVKTIQWGDLPTKINSKTTIDFIVRDFEALPPHCIIEFTEPLEAVMFFGMTKKYEKAAIRVDQPEQLHRLLSMHPGEKH